MRNRGEFEMKGIRYFLYAAFVVVLAPHGAHAKCDSLGYRVTVKVVSPEKSLYGYTDSLGAVVIEPIYEQVRLFCQGLAAAKRDGKWGFLDSNGKVRVNFLYQVVTDFAEGSSVVRDEDGYEYIDRTGKALTDGSYLRAQPITNGVAIVSELDAEGDPIVRALDSQTNFTPLLPKAYDDIKLLPGRNFAVKTDDRWSLLAAGGKPLTEEAFDEISPTGAPKVIALRKEGHWGFINTETKKQIPPQFVNQRSFANAPELTAVLGNQTWGIVNQEGELSTSLILTGKDYEVTLTSFPDGLGMFRTYGGYFYVNLQGKPATGNYVTALPFSEGNAIVKLNGLYGFLTKDNTWLVAPKYAGARSFAGGFAYGDMITYEYKPHWNEAYPELRQRVCKGVTEVINRQGEVVRKLCELNNFSTDVVNVAAINEDSSNQNLRDFCEQSYVRAKERSGCLK
jgi:hypothetical protein